MKMVQGLLTVVLGVPVVLIGLSIINTAIEQIKPLITIFYNDSFQIFTLVFSAMVLFGLVAVGINAMGFGQSSGGDYYD